MSSRPRIVLIDATHENIDELTLRRRARDAAADARCSSRSYRYPLALVALHDAEVGVDIERLMPFDEAFADTICTRRERERLREVGDSDEYLSSLWAGKEALAKALGNPLAYEPRRLEAPELWPDGTAGRWRAERVPVPPGHTAWVCWAEPGPRA